LEKNRGVSGWCSGVLSFMSIIFMDINLIHIYIYGYGSIPINTIFRGLFTSINPSYFDVNYRGTIGFDTLPYSIVRIIIIQLDVVPLSLQASWISGDWHDWVS